MQSGRQSGKCRRNRILRDLIGFCLPDTWVTLWGDGPQDTFYLEDGVARSEERFTLLVSTEKVDDFLFAQPALTLGERAGGDRGGDPIEAPRPLLLANAWATLALRVHVVRGAIAA